MGQLTIERFEFADGMVWDYARIDSEAVSLITGTAGADVLLGSVQDDTIDGAGGNDQRVFDPGAYERAGIVAVNDNFYLITECV